MDLNKIKAYLYGVSKEFKGKVVQVGFPTSAKYEDGTPVAYVAVINNYGAPAQGIPARPFFEPAIAAHKKEWTAFLGKSIGRVSKGQWTANDAFDALGYTVGSDIQIAIRDVTSPPLKPETIKRKGFAKPLIDKGLMIASVSYTVAQKGDNFTDGTKV